MRNALPRLFAVLLLAVLGAACSDAVAPARETAQLGFSANVAGTGITTLVVEVTGAGISSRLVYNVPVQNGVATGTIAVPAGTARTVAVKAYDAQGSVTHEGSKTVDVKPGNNPPLTVTLVPRPGHLPISVSFGTYAVSILALDGPANGVPVGAILRFQANVMDANAQSVASAVAQWATLDPAVATVDPNGVVTARGAGSTEIVATYQGYGSAVTFTVSP